MIVSMHLFVGAVLLLAGLGCLRYVWAGGATLGREPLFLAQGVLRVALGVGLGLRARMARPLAQVGLADDARLRPCRNGNDEACGAVARALLESAERAPSAPPTPAEERAARVLAGHRCRADDRGLCGLQRYAVGTVDARAGRLATARESFIWACEAHGSWCARAAREPVDWALADEQRLARAGRARVP